MGFVKGETKVNPVFLFDYLITWGISNDIIGKYQKIKYNKQINLWLVHEQSKVYGIDYRIDSNYNYGYFLLNISSFKNYDITEYNIDSFLMMRKYKLKYDKEKTKKEKSKDKIFQEENKTKEESLSAIEKLLRPKKRTKSAQGSN